MTQNKKFAKRSQPRNRQDNKNRQPRNNNNRNFNRNKPFTNSNPKNKNKFTREGRPALRLKRKPINRSKNQGEVKKIEKNQEKGRTLKVLGLHPEFSNEDLYVIQKVFRNYSLQKGL